MAKGPFLRVLVVLEANILKLDIALDLISWKHPGAGVILDIVGHIDVLKDAIEEGHRGDEFHL